MRNQVSFLFVFITIFVIALFTESIASGIFLLIIWVSGLLGVLIGFRNSKMISSLLDVFFLSFIGVAIVTFIQWMGNILDYSSFSDIYNDQYKFWLNSQEGAKAISLDCIFKKCIVDNIYIENGGYYLYIQTLAYMANHFSDGNHLYLQMMGSAASAIFSSVFIYLILHHYIGNGEIKKYTLYFIFLTPVLSNSIYFLRDPLVSFLYLCVIYLWLCKEFCFKTLVLQLLLSYVIMSIRTEHGLFALLFIPLSIYQSSSKYKLFYYMVLICVLILFGVKFYTNIIAMFNKTNDLYMEYGKEVLKGVNSGIGRYVYNLPSPIKEIAQVLLLQLQFPAWMDLHNAHNLPQLFIAVLKFFVNVFWFYIFTYTCYSIRKIGLRVMPIIIYVCIFLFFVFILLNTSNLNLRRVACIYPLFYLPFIIYYDKYSSLSYQSYFRRMFNYGYISLCLLYCLTSVLIG